MRWTNDSLPRMVAAATPTRDSRLELADASWVELGRSDGRRDLAGAGDRRSLLRIGHKPTRRYADKQVTDAGIGTAKARGVDLVRARLHLERAIARARNACSDLPHVVLANEQRGAGERVRALTLEIVVSTLRCICTRCHADPND